MNSTLAWSRKQYESEVGEFMGWGKGEAFDDVPWETPVALKIKDDVRSALSQFYFCGNHNWSFLKIYAEIVFREGETSADLPDDFGGVDAGANASIRDADDKWYGTLEFESDVRVMNSLDREPTQTGRPMRLAQQAKKLIPSGAVPKSRLVVFPVPDQAYTVRFPYYIAPNYLLDEADYPYGGVEHHQCILEHCLAVAEKRRDGIVGLHSMEAMRLLNLSILMDRRKLPIKLGYNGDTSDDMGHQRYGREMNEPGGVTINGVFYD